MRLVLAILLLSLGGCTWLYQSPYERALATPEVSPPPGLGLR